MADGIKTYILHGWTQDVSKWKPLLSLLKKSGIETVMLKIPGLTASLDTPWSLNDYQKWFARQVSAETKINVIAHSFGGRVAIRFDVKNPNKIKKLVLIDSSGVRPASWAASLKRMSFRALAKLGKKLTVNPRARQLLYTLAREKDYFEADKVLAETMSKIVEEDQRQDLPFVKAHTMIIWGSRDNTTPLSDGRLMNKTITGSSLRIVDGASHSPQYSHHQEVAKMIRDFLGKS